MAANKLQWKRIAEGDRLPCQSFLRKKDGQILKLSTVGGVKVGQDCYYLPVDEVINIIKDYPVEESEDERIRKALIKIVNGIYQDNVDYAYVEDGITYEQLFAYLEKKGEQKHENCMYSKDNYTDEDRKVLCDGCEEECELKKKPEWSEEDEERINSCIKTIHNSYYSNGKDIVFLKSLKERLQPQPKQE